MESLRLERVAHLRLESNEKTKKEENDESNRDGLDRCDVLCLARRMALGVLSCRRRRFSRSSDRRPRSIRPTGNRHLPPADSGSLDEWSRVSV